MSAKNCQNQFSHFKIKQSHTYLPDKTHTHLGFLNISIGFLLSNAWDSNSPRWPTTLSAPLSLLTSTPFLITTLPHALYALQTPTCYLLLMFALPLPPAVLELQPPQSGTHSHLAFTTLPLPTPFVAFLKLTVSSKPSAPPSDSPKCLRLDYWLTLCTLFNIHLLTYRQTDTATDLLWQPGSPGWLCCRWSGHIWTVAECEDPHVPAGVGCV